MPLDLHLSYLGKKIMSIAFACDCGSHSCMRHGICMSMSPVFPFLRSIRRSVRGSVKLKQQNYDHLKENGDIGAMNRTSSSRKPQDLDIKMLQAKRQQAEMRRYFP